MPRLVIGVSKYMEGEESFAAGRVVRVDGEDVQAVRVPVGRNRFLTLDVRPGSYLVQVELPSGVPLSRAVTVAEGEPESRVEFQGPESAHEWLSWFNFSSGSGALGSIPQRFDFARGESARNLASGDIEFRVGQDRSAIRGSISRLLMGGLEFDVRAESDGPYLVLNINMISRVRPDIREGPRAFVVAKQDAGRTFISIPFPWVSAESTKDPRRSVEVLLRDSLFDFEELVTAPARVSVTVRDPVFAAVFGYLVRDPSTALSVAGDVREIAIRTLEAKVMNPYAAAGAAYLLLRSGIGERRHGESWRQWLFNLADWFPWMPDGMVLAGWNLLDNSKKDARPYFLEAVRRGVPVYTEGVRLLIEGLSTLNRSPEDMELTRALKRARLFGVNVDPTQVFTIGSEELL